MAKRPQWSVQSTIIAEFGEMSVRSGHVMLIIDDVSSEDFYQEPKNCELFVYFYKEGGRNIQTTHNSLALD